MNITVEDKIGKMIEEAEQAEDFRLAKELSKLHIDIINERTRAWKEGYDCGWGLAKRDQELKKHKAKA